MSYDHLTNANCSGGEVSPPSGSQNRSQAFRHKCRRLLCDFASPHFASPAKPAVLIIRAVKTSVSLNVKRHADNSK